MVEPEWYDEVTTVDPAALEAASRKFVELRDDDPNRLMYGRRVRADGSVSLTCPMVPYWLLMSGYVAKSIEAYIAAGGR